MFTLCQVYAKATRSVSIPAPVYCEFRLDPFVEWTSNLIYFDVFRCQCEPLIIVSLILSHYFLACLFSRGISTGVPKPMAFNSTVRLPDWVPSDHQYAKYTTWTQNHCQWCMTVACFEDVSRLYSVTVGANTLLARVASCLIYTCNRLWCTYHPTSPT